MSTFVTLAVAIIGSTALATLVQFFVNRHDTKKKFGEKLETLEKDGLRTQLLMLILMKPDSKHEILTVGRHYFVDLKGDWYMTDMFKHWVKDQGDSDPDWFTANE